MATALHLAVEGVSASELAPVLGVARWTAGRYLRSLAAEGYLEAEVPETRRGRKRGDWLTLYTLTPRGREALRP